MGNSICKPNKVACKDSNILCNVNHTLLVPLAPSQACHWCSRSWTPSCPNPSLWQYCLATKSAVWFMGLIVYRWTCRPDTPSANQACTCDTASYITHMHLTGWIQLIVQCCYYSPPACFRCVPWRQKSTLQEHGCSLNSWCLTVKSSTADHLFAFQHSLSQAASAIHRLHMLCSSCWTALLHQATA